MPNIKSAKKRVKVIKKKTLENKMYRSSYKTMIKKYEAAIAAGDKEAATKMHPDLVAKTDRAAARGLIHKNAAARRKSRYTGMLAGM